MKPPPDPHYRHRFPAEVISHAVWLYHVFSLSLRDVELLLAGRGVVVSYETVRRWCKKFCQSFNFELQAAASDNAILLSLGPQHSFPLDAVPRFLASASVEQVVRQAVLTSPMFAARWRWNPRCCCSTNRWAA